MPECAMTREKFQRHMKNKAGQWNPDKMSMGDDFVVFEFNYEYQAKNAIDNLKHYSEFYGYSFAREKDKVSIINTCDTE